MRKDQYVTADELEQRRSCKAYCDWFAKKLPEIGRSEAGKRAYREREGFLKQFVCEALPIATLCERYFGSSESVFVTHIVGNQNYDAVVEDARDDSTGLEYLEITQASENFDSKHRMIYLSNHGSVPLFSELNVSRGEGGEPNVEIAESQALAHDRIVADIFDSIAAVAEKKANKHYPANTALVIVFDPGPAFRTPADEAALDECIVTRVLPQLTNFRTVFISAGDGGNLWQYPNHAS